MDSSLSLSPMDMMLWSKKREERLRWESRSSMASVDPRRKKEAGLSKAACWLGDSRLNAAPDDCDRDRQRAALNSSSNSKSCSISSSSCNSSFMVAKDDL